MVLLGWGFRGLGLKGVGFELTVLSFRGVQYEELHDAPGPGVHLTQLTCSSTLLCVIPAH